jgi:hypothetical protein
MNRTIQGRVLTDPVEVRCDDCGWEGAVSWAAFINEEAHCPGCSSTDSLTNDLRDREDA